MTPQEKERERLLWVLCARALQRHGEGFPSTEQEIEAFESSCVPSEEERARLKRLLPHILKQIRECGGPEEVESFEHSPPGDRARTLGDATRGDRTEAPRAAARAADRQRLSPDLLKRIERVIEQSEEASDQEEPKQGDATQDDNRER